MATDYSRTPPIEPGWYWAKTDRGIEVAIYRNSDRTNYWEFGDQEYDDELLLRKGFQFGPRIQYPGQSQSEDISHCPGCLSRQQTVSMLRSDLNIANRDYRQLLDRDAELDRQIDQLNAQLVDAIHWRDQYRRDLDSIRRGVDTTQMGE